MSDELAIFVPITQPPGMKKHLFPHQLNAICMMEKREEIKQITAFHYQIDLTMGIYADIAGFGKTLTILGLISRDRMRWDVHEDFIQTSIINVYGNGCIIKRSRTFFKRAPTNLIVASPTVALQWVDELKQTDLRYFLVTNRKTCHHVDPNEYDVLVVSNSCYNLLMDRFPHYAWKRFIYDDPTHCRIPSMRSIVAGYIWMLSATPEMLLYQQHRSSNNFMSSIFCSYLDYNIYKHLIIKNDDDYVRQSYALPPLYETTHPCHEPVVWIVRDLISPVILDMVSAGDIQGAVRAMGGTSASNLYDLVVREKMESLQQAEWKISRFERVHDAPRVEKWTLKKQRIEEELNQLHHRLSRVLEENKCHICFDNLKEPVVLTCCQNIFCGKCILQWISSNMNMNSVCPLCRRYLTSDHLVYMQQQPTSSTSSPTPTPGFPSPPFPSKINVLRNILKGDHDNSGDHDRRRFIIFSSYDETFHRIRQILKDMDIAYGELHGRADTRSRTIETFKNGATRVLFLNCVQYGAGENLQEATDVILYHDMTELMKTQIIGRAYRIGRKEPLRVHYLKTEHIMPTI